MALEVERKFLVTKDDYRTQTKPTLIRQGYLNSSKERIVRVRLQESDAWLTIKSITVGLERAEFEYAIPGEDARQLLALCESPLLSKLRYAVPFGGFTWEVDEFLGENQGLVIAEVELGQTSSDPPKPPWVGEEVSRDPRYFNSNLLTNPYSKWTS